MFVVCCYIFSLHNRAKLTNKKHGFAKPLTKKKNTEKNFSFCEFYCTKMYPMVWMFLFPLSVLCFALIPQVLGLSSVPAIPNPILESHVPQSFSLFPRIPILAFEKSGSLHLALNPSLPQFLCKDPSGPINDFHVSRPSDVEQYSPSAISENKELASLEITMKLVFCPFFIPRQIFEKFVFQ